MILYFMYFVYKSGKRAEIIKKNKKRITIAVLIILFFITPVLAYNYILYEQKGITDVLFARFFHLNREFFSGLQGYDESYSFSSSANFLPGFLKAWLFSYDPPIFFLAILGFILIFLKNEYKTGRFFVLFHILPFLFLSGSAMNWLHFVSFVPLACVGAAVFIEYISIKASDKINKNKLIFFILIIILISNIWIIKPHLTSQSAIFKMREYSITNFNEKDIVIADARIYRSRIAWIFNDKSYLESSFFGNMIAVNQNLSANSMVQTPVYFVECISDDCGWGTIGSQPEFNQSVEQLFDYIKNNTLKTKIIYGGGGYSEDYSDSPYFAVYKTFINLNPQIYQFIYQTHEQFYYPVRWKKAWYDKYEPQGVFQTSLNSIGKVALWLAVILAFIIPIIIIRRLIKENKR